MKITLWQQFSSNHSASFSVVGIFESTEKAEEVANTIREVVGKIGDYYRKRFPEPWDFYEWAEEIDVRSLSKVEQAIKKEYQIRGSWLYPPDWAYNSTPVRVYKNMLFVSSQGDTWSPFSPVDSLIKQAGGKFYANQEGFGYCSFRLVCEAKDKESAEQIANGLRLIEHKYNFEYIYVQIPDGLRFSAEIEVEGQQLRFKNIEIYASSRNDGYDTAKVLDALVTYLEAQGCSEFQYEFSQK